MSSAASNKIRIKIAKLIKIKIVPSFRRDNRRATRTEIPTTSRAKYRCDIGRGRESIAGLSLPKELSLGGGCSREWPTPVVVPVKRAVNRRRDTRKTLCKCSNGSRDVTRREPSGPKRHRGLRRRHAREGTRGVACSKHATRGCHRGRSGGWVGGQGERPRRKKVIPGIFFRGSGTSRDTRTSRRISQRRDTKRTQSSSPEIRPGITGR